MTGRICMTSSEKARTWPSAHFLSGHNPHCLTSLNMNVSTDLVSLELVFKVHNSHRPEAGTAFWFSLDIQLQQNGLPYYHRNGSEEPFLRSSPQKSLPCTCPLPPIKENEQIIQSLFLIQNHCFLLNSSLFLSLFTSLRLWAN